MNGNLTANNIEFTVRSEHAYQGTHVTARTSRHAYQCTHIAARISRHAYCSL